MSYYSLRFSIQCNKGPKPLVLSKLKSNNFVSTDMCIGHKSTRPTYTNNNWNKNPKWENSDNKRSEKTEGENWERLIESWV